MRISVKGTYQLENDMLVDIICIQKGIAFGFIPRTFQKNPEQWLWGKEEEVPLFWDASNGKMHDQLRKGFYSGYNIKRRYIK
jgi:hypothetical protein